MTARRSLLNKMLVGSVASVVIVVFLIVVENARGRWGLQSYRNTLTQREEKLTVAELLPTPATTTQSALDLEAATKALSAIQKEKTDIVPYLRAMKMAGPGQAFVTFRGAMPETGRRGRGSDKKELPPPTWPDLAGQIAKGEMALQQIKTALRSPVEFAIDYADVNPARSVSLNVPIAASWLIGDAVNSLHNGDLVRATESLVTLGELPKILRQERSLVSQTLSIGITAFSRGVFWEALQADGWTDAQLAAIQNASQSEESFSSVLAALEMERARLPLYFDLCRKSAAGRTLLLQSKGFDMTDMLSDDPQMPVIPNEAIVWLRSSAWRVMWSHQDESHAIREWQEALENARQLAVDKSWLASSFHTQQLPSPIGIDAWRYQFSTIMAPAVAHGVLHSAIKLETQHALMTCAIALKRHSLQHSAPPANLSELVPAFLERAPTDWFDGKPVRYRADKAGGFVLYSVGEDGKDDGGDATQTKEDNFNNFSAGRDYLWPTAVIERR